MTKKPTHAAPDAPELELLLHAVEARLAQERGAIAWLRSRPTWLRASFAATWIMLLVAAAGFRGAGFSITNVHRQLALLAYATVLVFALAELLRPTHRFERSALQRGLSALAILTPLLVPFLSLVAPDPSAVARLPGCMTVGISVAVFTLAWLRALDRTGHGARSTALLAVGVAGLSGNLALALYCPSAELSHLLRWHMPVGLLVVLPYVQLLRRRGARLPSG